MIVANGEVNDEFAYKLLFMTVCAFDTVKIFDKLEASFTEKLFVPSRRTLKGASTFIALDVTENCNNPLLIYVPTSLTIKLFAEEFVVFSNRTLPVLSELKTRAAGVLFTNETKDVVPFRLKKYISPITTEPVIPPPSPDIELFSLKFAL